MIAMNVDGKILRDVSKKMNAYFFLPELILKIENCSNICFE